jgi:hypothetical protein
MKIPYIGYGNDTLRDLPRVKEGDEVFCDKCGARHPLEAATNTETGAKSDIYFYRCGEKTFLGAVGGKLVAYTKCDVSGEL